MSDPTKETKFTSKQRKFIDFYCGNATDAARKAGYKNAELSGLQNMGKYRIAKEIKAREEKEASPIIADRKERQAFWTETQRNQEYDISSRLRASELLGRSEADFIDTTRHTDKDGNNLLININFISPVAIDAK